MIDRAGILATVVLVTGFLLTTTVCRGAGLNLPPTRGSSNQGSFLPGVYQYNYDDADIARIQKSHFDSFRLLVNVQTCNNPRALNKILALFSQLGNRGIICMIDTNQGGETGHGNGRVNDLNEMAAAWKKVYQRAKRHRDIKFEVFNEPFGYESADEYLKEMNGLIAKAGLPEDRCILDGIGYAENIQSVSEAGWSGSLAYHFYPNWLPKDEHSVKNFSQLIQSALSGVSNQIYITEFGAKLERGDVYDDVSATDEDVMALQGLQDALLQITQSGQSVEETFHWHGWDNGDSYSYWDDANQFGAKKIRQLQNAPRAD